MDEYPNDGSYYQPTEPEDQVVERQQQTSKAQAAKPMLEELIVRAQERIAVLTSADAIHVSPDAKPDDFMRAHYGVQERLSEVRENLNHLETLLKITH